MSSIRARWTLAAVSIAAAVGIVTWALALTTGHPAHPGWWFLGALALIPIAFVVSGWLRSERLAATALVQSVVALAVVLVVVASYLVFVVGMHGSPGPEERDVMTSSVIAAIVAIGLAILVRPRVVEAIQSRLQTDAPTTAEAVGGFTARMSRAIPMDELLLQLVESLRDAAPGTRAEVWTGSAGALTLAASVPTRPAARMSLAAPADVTVARARIGGPAWVKVWLPQLVPEDDAHGDYRIVPVAHLGELLGLVAVYRPPEAVELGPEDEASLVELARQLGLALHNVQLDAALQDSLDELARRNEELQLSRARIVAASDESRRQIERNLHDGVQQHLVALAVKVGLIKTLMDSDAATATGLLDELRGDVQTTLTELRELAHGIYPPLLRDRGLGEALQAAANRSTLPTSVAVAGAARYDADTEAAVYFCCLEAMQNAGKHAGADAQLTVEVGCQADGLWFEVSDDGAGFDATTAEHGHGFVNMRDRLGALGGELTVSSTIGAGSTIRGTLVAHPTPTDGP